MTNKTTTDKLIGLFGYLIEPQTFEVTFQFEIVSRINETLYLVKLFTPEDGQHWGDMMIVTLHTLHDYHRCRLYSELERWEQQGEELEKMACQKAAERVAAQQPLRWMNDKGEFVNADGSPRP